MHRRAENGPGPQERLSKFTLTPLLRIPRPRQPGATSERFTEGSAAEQVEGSEAFQKLYLFLRESPCVALVGLGLTL